MPTSLPGAKSHSSATVVAGCLAALVATGSVRAVARSPVTGDLAALQSAPVPAVGTEAAIRLRAVDDSGIEFHHVYGTPDKAYITESGGSGAAWVDYDVDGRLDLLLVNGLEGLVVDPVAASRAGLAGGRPDGGHALFRNVDGRFERAPEDGGVGDHVWGNGAAVGDVDNDGFADLFVTATGPDRLYRNNGDGTFSARVSGVEDDGWGTSATFTDWDGDGLLDLYVARYVDFAASAVARRGQGRCFYLDVEAFCGPEGLAGQRDRFYRNGGGFAFTPWYEDFLDPEATYGFALAAFDCDSDGQPELFVANDSNINLLYRRAPAGALEDLSLISGAGYSGDGREQAGMGVSAADYDADGRLDLFVTNFQNDHNTLYRNLGGCAFQDMTDIAGLAVSSFPTMGWGALFVDLDGDADDDLFVANGHIHPAVETTGVEPYKQPNLLYRNLLRETGVARFELVRDGPGAIESSRGTIRGDFDNDGDLDLLVTNMDAAPTLLRNDTSGVSPALRLTLVGRDSARSAHGARVRVVSGDSVQQLELRDSDGYAGANDARLLVHLPAGRADSLEVFWRSGARTALRDVEPGWIVLDEAHGVIARRPR